jgi:cation transport ATPase
VVVFDKTGTLTEGGNPSVTNHDIMASSAEETKVI